MVAIQMKTLMVFWIVYSITNDALALGFIGLAEVIPSISIVLYAGHYVDKCDKKTISTVVLVFTILSSLGLFIVTSESVIRVPHERVLYIYVFVVITGLIRGFLGPSLFSLGSLLVPREIYSNSSTWNSLVWQLSVVIGPAIGGVTYSFLGTSFTFSIILLLLVIAIITISKIGNKPIVIVEKESINKSLLAGLRFVFNNKVIFGALSLDLFAVLFGGAVALLLIFAKDVLEVGIDGLGLLRETPAIGAIITMVLLTKNHFIINNSGKVLMFSVRGLGLSMIFFALSNNFLLSLILLIISGGFDSISVVIRAAIVQLFTPENMRGRVSAVNNIFIGSSNEIGYFESGVAAKLMGLIPSVIFGGMMTLLVVILTSFKSTELRNLRLNEIK